MPYLFRAFLILTTTQTVLATKNAIYAMYCTAVKIVIKSGMRTPLRFVTGRRACYFDRAVRPTASPMFSWTQSTRGKIASQFSFCG